MDLLKSLQNADPEIAQLIDQETQRQHHKIELIASENFVSEAVMTAMGSPLTNKYAEGYPGKRYYGGCEVVDQVENLAIDRAKQLFKAAFVNVQPHSGSQANFAVYHAFLKPGDTILGMNLAHGGHLTHGSPVNISGAQYRIVSYGVNRETEQIDYDMVRKIAKKERPRLIIAGASAYSRVIDFKQFREIADEVGAFLMVDMAHIAGLVAAGLHPSPVPYAHVVTTTTHKTLRGPRGGMILCNDEAIATAINKAVFPGIQGGPLCHVIAAKAVSFKEALQPSFVEYQRQVVVNAKALAGGLQKRGFTIVSGGTDTHVMLVNLRSKALTGKKAEAYLDEAYITCNKNAIPFDTEKPWITSGIRLGTPAVTTRGMKETEMDQIAGMIDCMLTDPLHPAGRVRAMVEALTERFPLYPNRREE